MVLNKNRTQNTTSGHHRRRDWGSLSLIRAGWSDRYIQDQNLDSFSHIFPIKSVKKCILSKVYTVVNGGFEGDSGESQEKSPFCIQNYCNSLPFLTSSTVSDPVRCWRCELDQLILPVNHVVGISLPGHPKTMKRKLCSDLFAELWKEMSVFMQWTFMSPVSIVNCQVFYSSGNDINFRTCVTCIFKST